jgi:hypothetical protein
MLELVATGMLMFVVLPLVVLKLVATAAMLHLVGL